MLYIAKHKTLRKSINMPLTNYKLIFITLTLASAQIHSDRVIKEKLLQPFIRQLRNRWKCVNYLWKAEAQDNGNIHFHILTDQYIYWQEIRDTWNAIQETLGYITNSTTSNPNGTDVHAVYKKKNPAGYLAGYYSKKDQYKSSKEYVKWNEHYYKELLEITACDLKTRKEVGIKRTIEGKLYDCNQELKGVKCTLKQNRLIEEDLYTSRLQGHGGKSTDFFEVQYHNHPTKRLPALEIAIRTAIEWSYRNRKK